MSTKVTRAAARASPKRKRAAKTDEPAAKKTKKEDVKQEPQSPKKPRAKPKSAPKAPKKEETPDTQVTQEDIHRWWEELEAKEDDSIKWETLEHSGVLFPPPYEPLPPSVHLVYDGVPVALPLEAEEVAGFFGAMLNSDHCKNPTFTKNFFADFLEVLKDSGTATNKATNKPVDIVDFDKCDFSVIFDHYERQREAKKALSAAEKKRIKAEKDVAEEKYKTCLFNGRRENVGNFRIEPPGLFRGRGAHPKTGKLKARVQPEQVTINIGEGVPVPDPPEGHEWAEVRHDKTVSWLAMWKENINGNTKYVFLAQNSSLKGVSDYKKFEKARELKKHVAAIRKDYQKELSDKVMANRQRATAMYLIDVLALRAGGEKGEDEADTVGCCSLRYEHVTLEPPNLVTFDFLGKDSIRYFQQVEVDKRVFNNLKIFKKAPKKEGDDIFDRLDPSILNRHLQHYMPGLTAKVFRTYNASHTMQQQLDKIPNEGTVNEKVVKFNAANREVAILCNHQRTVSKGHESSVQKIEERIEELVWQKIRLKKMILQLAPKMKETLGKEYWEDLEIYDKNQLRAIHSRILEKEREKVNKKFLRDNEKLQSKIDAGETDVELLAPSDLETKLETVDKLGMQYEAELNGGEMEIKASLNPDKLQVQISKLEERITNTRLSLQDKQENSAVALSTSKMNYIDPRLTVMFSKKYNVPIEKLFTKTLREKFAWAIHSVDKDWKF